LKDLEDPEHKKRAEINRNAVITDDFYRKLHEYNPVSQYDYANRIEQSKRVQQNGLDLVKKIKAERAAAKEKLESYKPVKLQHSIISTLKTGTHHDEPNSSQKTGFDLGNTLVEIKSKIDMTGTKLNQKQAAQLPTPGMSAKDALDAGTKATHQM